MAILSIPRLIAELAARDPGRPAITFEGRTITRQELDAASNRLARAYAQAGVGQDGMVSIALPNGIEFYLACLAAWKLGATPQPVSSRLPRPELEAIVELANPALVVGAPAGWFPGRPQLPAGYEPPPGFSDAPLPDRVARAWKAPTSGGSTGRPKIIVSGAPAEFDTDELPLEMLPDRTQLVPGPLYHNGPFIFSMRGLLLGHHLVVLPRFDAQRALTLLAQHRVDWVNLVPTMMHRIWRLGPAEHARHDLSALRVLLHLAAPCPPWLKEQWIAWLGPERVFELYGGTEGTGVTWITGTEWLSHRGSVGKIMEGYQMRVLGPDGAVLPPGEVGEVFLRPDTGPGTTYRYIGATPKAREGWESLGDLGWMDEEGYLYLTDRHTDMILCGGANVYPAEVEAALDSHPAVRSSAVIGLPDEDLG
ncbi:MAG TPA: AMP-binding protein, partial [bacterium]|nr:AMP-binding protein [bacterium]